MAGKGLPRASSPFRSWPKGGRDHLSRRDGARFIRQELFPWYWKCLPLVPLLALGWHGYKLGTWIPPGISLGMGDPHGWLVYPLLLLLLPFVENRFHLVGGA